VTAIQAAKAGILEVGDVYVVNKADRDGADATLRELRHMLTLGPRGSGDWRPPVVKAVASREQGIDEVVEALEKHRGWLAETGQLRVRRHRRVADEVESIALTALRLRMGDLRRGRRLDDLADRVLAGDIDPVRRRRPAHRGPGCHERRGPDRLSAVSAARSR
jgi:LAO/AO transport system kinase